MPVELFKMPPIKIFASFVRWITVQN